MTAVAATSETDGMAGRRAWMSVLAKAPAGALARMMPDPLPSYVMLRQPETGLVMVRGRAGGHGQAFNLGEMTVTRCTVQIDRGIVGHAYIAGRDRRHAELAAVADAMLQHSEHAARVMERVLEPLKQAAQAALARRAQEAAATKVEFFTVAREAGQ